MQTALATRAKSPHHLVAGLRPLTIMQVVYAQQPFPEAWSKSIFLAGPTPRATKPVPSWRPDALAHLRAIGYDGVVFVPEPADGTFGDDYDAQIDWERKAFHLADVLVFWVPRELDTLPGFTTNVEFGRWADSHKFVLGHPPGAPKTRYLDSILAEVANAEPYASLEETLGAAIERLGDGADRSGGERYVPLHVWNAAFFQRWYDDLKKVGNRLDEAQVRWVFYLPHIQKVLAGVLWVKVWIEAEGRHKANEWIFGRTDISAVVLFQQPRNKTYSLETLLKTEVVLIREFRSPARSPDGFVRELASGSSASSDNARAVAIREVREETGLEIPDERIIPLGSRQAASTVSTHIIHLFMAALTADEMKHARTVAEKGTVFGNPDETERTVVELRTVRDLLDSAEVDWSTAGMVLKAMYEWGKDWRRD